MSRLVISARHLQTLGRHATMSYPDECCGVLIGRSSQGTTVVERVLLVGNERENGRSSSYLIGPETVLAAQKEARALGLEVVGYYHSHPDGAAEPGSLDLENAWPGVSYLIVSLAGRRVVEARSFRLSSDRKRFEEESMDSGAGGLAAYAGVHKEAV